jgi:hypothetical protein
MRYKADSDDTEEYPQSGIIHEKDLKGSTVFRPQCAEKDGRKEWEAWDRSWKQQHPEWFPDKDGKPWHQYWDEYWSSLNRRLEKEEADINNRIYRQGGAGK